MKTIQELLGLKVKQSEILVEKLNLLLANFEIFNQNLRSFHWNIKGDKFFELHEKFEELGNEAAASIDEVAERILTLGGVPLHTFSDFVKTATIKEENNIKEAVACMTITTENMAAIVRLEKAILLLAQEAEDEGTIALLTDFISKQEKTVWMLLSWFEK